MTEQPTTDILVTPPDPNPDKERVRAELLESMKETTLEEIDEIMNVTIKGDVFNARITFLSMILNYTAEDQQNIIFRSESSRGKTYLPLEIGGFFPQEDIVKFMACSPRAFYHEYGSYDKERKVIMVNLERKILIFLDQVGTDLLKELRPLLSHDQKVLVSKITDRNKRHGHSTKTVEIVGYPTVIHCSATGSLSEQEQTRCFVLSPEASKEKLEASIQLLFERLSNRDVFKKWLDENPRRQWLMGRIESIRTAHVQQIVIPEDVKLSLALGFKEDHASLAPRHQRDVVRLMALVKAHALLNYSTRKHINTPEGTSIEATNEDAIQGYLLYKYIAESNEIGITPETYEIWTQLIQPRLVGTGFLKRELSIWYFKEYHRNLTNKRLDSITLELITAGLLYEEQDKDDNRKKRYFDSTQAPPQEKQETYQDRLEQD